MNHQDEKFLYHPNRSPAPLMRVRIVVCRCERVIEEEYRGLKLYAVIPKVCAVFPPDPHSQNQLLGLDPVDVV